MPDLASIPGLAPLWERTLGDPGVRIAVLDGPVEVTHPCFDGADLTVLEPGWLPGEEDKGEGEDGFAEHGTHIASVLFGQHGSPVTGIAPRCSGVIVPCLRDKASVLDPVSLTRGIEAAVDAAVDIIHIAVCMPTSSDDADGMLKRAIARATDAGVLIVAPSGNDCGECRCIPAALPQVLAVGACDDDGTMFKFSNFGPQYRDHGIVAPGGNIHGAAPGGKTAIHKGTSCAAPIVTGVAALLLSLRRQHGMPPDPAAVRAALLESAWPCRPEDAHGEPARCMAGKLDIGGTAAILFPQPPPAVPASRAPASVSEAAAPTEVAAPARAAAHAAGVVTSGVGGPAWSPLAYVLGTLGYDFGTEARRDSFKQLMAAVSAEGTAVPANPYDSRQMVDHLRLHPSEATSLIWTLNLELTPVYAIESTSPYAAGVYELLTRLLAGQVAAEDDEEYIERVSIPGRLTGRTVKLFSGQVVPVIEVAARRGMYGWNTNTLAAAALQAARRHPTGENEALTGRFREFLARIYYDLRNLGTTSADRALNFAATNAFQAADTFASAVADGMTLDTIDVEKSPFCRLHSDCWDVKLRFFDPENNRRARKVHRFTIDVSDLIPVTLGTVRTWSER
ncbi:PatA/PatG family cyanobactin maturation protease [Streptomyces gobiensis]|uniref:PatA/PatG family cyanobactin maturation protease n=1 Tax=Streptomyces gobiensis TaxID=2875706 RepID=UPI001E587706|nr:PatA/PatG family cyanobactin maturation protease [Streptomyces gobiensis]UGY91094.1 PatA/PatG family cyanobactin maturation protease [Streptomyces gobiensis]